MSGAAMLRYAFCVMSLSLLTPVWAVGELPAPPTGAWRLAGQGDMRWLGMKLYEAQLWLGGPSAKHDEYFALVLTYARDVSKDRLISASIDEMRRVGTTDPAFFSRWRSALDAAFPNVAAGEQIIGVNVPGKGVRFYHQGRLRYEIADVDFAKRFFAIWLDPRTRDPVLRARLLGVAE